MDCGTYREQVDRAAALDEQIERTDALIDEIVDFYPALSLADIHTAITFDCANIEEFRGSHPGTDGEREMPP